MTPSLPVIGSTSSTCNLLAEEDPFLEERSSSFNRTRHGKHVHIAATTKWFEWVEKAINKEVPEQNHGNENSVGDNGSKPSLVCRNVREKLRRVNPEAYIPTFFRFGPFHASYDEKCPQSEQKVLVARRCGQQTFNDLRGQIENREESMRSFYQWQDSRSMLSSHEYSTQLTLDAMMIASRLLENGSSIHGPHDSLKFFDDIILFENQIPLSAIKLAYQCTKVTPFVAQTQEDQFLTQVDLFWSRHRKRILFDFPSDLKQEHISNSVHNTCLLGLLYKLFAEYISFSSGCETYRAQSSGIPEKEYVAHVPIPTATKLREHTGIRFKSRKTCPLVKFDAERRTLYLPKIHVSTTSERVLRNVLAYEAESGVVSREERVFTGYVLLMDDLIDKDGDVEVLVESGVIENSMGSHEAVAKLWNNLCAELPRYSTDGWVYEATNINAYYKMTVNRWKALFYEIYWQRKPWLLISIVTAFLLLVLTLLQTLYTAWGFYKFSQ